MPLVGAREPDYRVLGAPGPPRDVAELRRTAAEQRGLLTSAQCRSAGLSAKAVRWRLGRGTWTRIHRGVYQTQPGREDWTTAALAAQVAVPGSAWSHRTAGHLHGLVRRPPTQSDLIVDERRRVAAPTGVTVHRRADADAYVDHLHWPWRVDVENTVLDLAELGDESDVLALLGTAFHRGVATEATLLRLLAARSRHRRRGLLIDVLSDVAGGAHSVMEVRFLRDVERAHGLPIGRRQAATVVGSLRLHDVAYDEQRVLVELDGRLGHDGAARVADGIRDRRSALTGWLTVRGFWVDVAVTPCVLARDLGHILTTRGWTGAVRPCRRRSCAPRDVGASRPR
jgi:predicted transcriptional regulator of viral defense system